MLEKKVCMHILIIIAGFSLAFGFVYDSHVKPRVKAASKVLKELPLENPRAIEKFSCKADHCWTKCVQKVGNKLRPVYKIGQKLVAVERENNLVYDLSSINTNKDDGVLFIKAEKAFEQKYPVVGGEVDAVVAQFQKNMGAGLYCGWDISKHYPR